MSVDGKVTEKVVFLTVRVDPELYDAFRQLTATEERTVSQDIRRYMRERVTPRKRRRAA